MVATGVGRYRPDTLQRFVIRAIANERQRQQPVSRKQVFWAEAASLRAEMGAEGIWVDVDEIWGVRHLWIR